MKLDSIDDLPWGAGPEELTRLCSKRLAAVECRDTTFLSDDFPIFWKRAQGEWIEDVEGHKYLDLTAGFGVASVGYGHPDWLASLQNQSALLSHGMGDVHPPYLKIELLEKLAAWSSIPNTKSILTGGGAEAVEAALKTAMIASGKPGVLAFKNAYHGLTYGTLEVNGRAFFKEWFLPQCGGFARFAPFPDKDEEVWRAGDDYLNEFLDEKIGAILLEPIQGRGGIIVPPDGFLKKVRRICDERGILMILDEIFTGFGRTGRKFACDEESVIPDLMAVGKGMTGGFPMGACLGTSEVMDAWQISKGEARHTSTFLGNPLAAAAVLGTLSIIEKENLIDRARILGEKLITRLRIWESRFGVLVRGKGFMIGVKFKESGMASKIMKASLKKGVIILSGGPQGEVLTFTPPFVIQESNLMEGVARIENVIDHFMSGQK